MCGIFGFLQSSASGRLDLSLLKNAAAAAARRGPEAFGYAALCHSRRSDTPELVVRRRPHSLLDHLSCLNDLAEAAVVIGHTRLATSPDTLLHNAPRAVQPFVADGVALAHNGNIYNHRALAEAYHLAPRTGCDSEVLALLAAHHRHQPGAPSPLHCAHRALCVATPSPLAALFLLDGRLLAARRRLPLYAVRRDEGIYLGSVPFSPECAPLPDNAVCDLNAAHQNTAEQSTLALAGQCLTEYSLSRALTPPSALPERPAPRESAWQRLRQPTSQC